MTLVTFRQRKANMEKAILTAIAQFQLDTGAVVNNVDLIYAETFSAPKQVVGVKVEVEI